MVKNELSAALYHEALGYESLLRKGFAPISQQAADIEGLLRETHERILNRRPHGIESARDLAQRIAQEVGLDYLAKTSRRHDRVVVNIAAPDNARAAGLLASTDREDIEMMRLVSIARGLPTPCRQVFTLRKVYGFSLEEIAERLGLTLDEVFRHVTLASSHCAHAFQIEDTPRAERIARWLAARRLRRQAGH